jgi:hypothetical protein
MEFKKDIVQNVSDEIKTLFSNNINSLVNIAVNETLEKEKEIFYEKLNACQEIFPIPTEQGIFRFCGCCNECKLNYLDSNTISNAKTRKQQRINSSKNIIKNVKGIELLKGEYLLLCTMEPPTGPCLNSGAWIITNYGRVYGIGLYNVNLCDPRLSRIQNSKCMKHTEPSPVNQEYLKIQSLFDFHVYQGNNNYQYNDTLVNQLMDIYREYHPKASEIFTIEQKTLKLKDKEVEIKLLEDNYLKKYEELSNKEDELIKKEIKLENDIQVHKEKIKHLFKRENNVKLKETINSCKNELLQSAFKLNDIISIIPWPEDDDYDLIKQNINNVISIMNKLT